ncbi:MAG: hypothetical protein FJ137_22060, partial [Deltaproteobacteria bacterium]|nr:hypothetical protein [Deltaproteobacteria bacterium]
MASLVAATAGCRGTDELVQSIGAHVFVVGVDDDALVQLDVDGQCVRSVPDRGSNLVSFSLPLPEGPHDGTVTVFDVERRGDDGDDGDDDDDDGDDGDDDEERFGAGELRAERCGPFFLEVIAGGEPTALAIVADDLPRCGDDAADPAEGEGEGEGEGEPGPDEPEDNEPEDNEPEDNEPEDNEP